MPRPRGQLEVPTNFDKLSKNVRILKIRPLEAKLWEIRHFAPILTAVTLNYERHERHVTSVKYARSEVRAVAAVSRKNAVILER